MEDSKSDISSISGGDNSHLNLNRAYGGNNINKYMFNFIINF